VNSTHAMEKSIFPLNSRQVYNRNTEVSILPPSFDYWNMKFRSWLINPNLRNTKLKVGDMATSHQAPYPIYRPNQKTKMPYGLLQRKWQSRGRRVRCSPSYRPIHLRLHLHATSTMMPRARSVLCLRQS
jgi:hypothetical protein